MCYKCLPSFLLTYWANKAGFREDFRLKSRKSGFESRKSCITALGYDHMSILGDTIEEIATNKCGIIHPFTNLVFCQRQPIRAAQEVVQKFAPQITDSTDLPPGAKLGLSGKILNFIIGRAWTVQNKK